LLHGFGTHDHPTTDANDGNRELVAPSGLVRLSEPDPEYLGELRNVQSSALDLAVDCVPHFFRAALEVGAVRPA